MEYEKIIHNYVTENRSEILNTLKELVKIPSVRGRAEKNAPFGRDCADILEYTKKLYEANGFETELDGEGGYLLSYFGDGDKNIGIFAHADVVDVSDDWVHTSPFEPTEKEGFLIGRGVLDDKSAIVISLYCAKMFKELKLPLKSKLVMYTGGNEESGMQDIDNYLAKHQAPEFSLVCDTAFPIFRGNKSGMNCWVRFKSELESIDDFSGGTAMNITLGKATATLGENTVEETGVSRHSALPEGSVNAGYLLAKKLYESDMICDADKKQMLLLMTYTEKYYGESFGIEHTDKDFGKLTCTNGVIKTENGKITLGLNLRFGLTADVEEIKQKMQKFCTENDCTIEFEEEKRGYIVPENDKHIKACLKAYSDFTGDENPITYLNSGGTYGRKLLRAAETGTALRRGVPQNTPAGHGGVHQPDECLNIDGFFDALELTAHMLLECDKVG